MSSELLIGLAGGAIGSVLTALFVQAGRAWVAWGEVGLHDQESIDRNRRLRVWVDDRTRDLVVEMSEITNRLAAAGQLYSGALLRAKANAKAKALHEYRDEAERARIDLARLRATEGAWHSFWRKMRTRPAPHLTADADVEPFLERWREAASHAGDGGEELNPIDRTRRTFDDALAELPDLELN